MFFIYLFLICKTYTDIRPFLQVPGSVQEIRRARNGRVPDDRLVRKERYCHGDVDYFRTGKRRKFHSIFLVSGPFIPGLFAQDRSPHRFLYLGF